MAKHRTEGPVNDVMVTDLYIGEVVPENIVGKIIMTDGENAVMVFDEQTVGRSVKKLLEPPSVLRLSATDAIRTGDRRDLATHVYSLATKIDLSKYTQFFKQDETLF